MYSENLKKWTWPLTFYKFYRIDNSCLDDIKNGTGVRPKMSYLCTHRSTARRPHLLPPLVPHSWPACPFARLHMQACCCCWCFAVITLISAVGTERGWLTTTSQCWQRLPEEDRHLHQCAAHVLTLIKQGSLSLQRVLSWFFIIF